MQLRIHLDEPGCLNDILGDDESRVVRPAGTGENFTLGIATLERGTQQGRPSAALAFRMPDGTPVLLEVSVRLLQTVAAATVGRYGDQTDGAFFASRTNPMTGGERIITSWPEE